MNYAIIDKDSGEVLNCVAWDGDLGKWAPPTGTLAVRCQAAGRGDDWDGSRFYRVEISRSIDGDGNEVVTRTRVGDPFTPQPEGGRQDQKERPPGWEPRALIELRAKREAEKEAARVRAEEIAARTAQLLADEAAAEVERLRLIEEENAAAAAKVKAEQEARHLLATEGTFVEL